MNLPEFSVRHSVFGNVLFVVIVIVGMMAAFSAKRELFPATDLDLVVVNTLYPGAMPEEVENHVTIPIEDEIRGVAGVDKYLSTSVENLSSIVVYLDPDADNKERIINDILRKVDRVRFENERIEDPDVEVIVTREMVIHVCVGGAAPEAAVRAYAEQLESRLAALDNVASIMKTGWRSPEIWVEADAQALKARDLSIFQVSESLRRHNINLPGGKIPEGATEMILRTTAQFATLDDVRNVVVRSNADGKHIRIGDIAEVTNALAEDESLVRANGKRAVMLSVEKKTAGDTIRIADAVKALIAAERMNLPEGIELSVLDFESYVIKRRLNVLLSNGALGLTLVLLCLPLLMNFRIAILTAIGIPFAFLTALLVMAYFDVSINMMTMFGMILVVGMLVDDAIILAENVFRHLEAGKPPREAAVAGAMEVMWPVTATVLTTIAAFLPLAFLGGIMGKFMRWIPIVVMITLGASLFEALVILPCHIADLSKPLQKNHGSKNSHGGRGSRWSSILQNRYESLLRRVLRHPALFIGIVLLVFVGSVLFAFAVMDSDLFPADMIDIFFAYITMERSASLDATEATVAEIERRIQAELGAHGELADLLTEVGHHRDQHMASFTRGSRYAMVSVYLTPAQKRERSAQDLIGVMESVCADVTNSPAVERLTFELVKPGPPGGKSIDIRAIGKDYAVLEQIAAEVKAELAGMKGVKDIEDNYEAGKDELRISPDPAEAARLGLDAETVARAVYAAFHGAEATSIRGSKEETVVRVKLPDRQRTIENLLQLEMPNQQGRLIELGRVTTTNRTQGISGISHHNGERVISVMANIEYGNGAATGRKVPVLRRTVQRVKASWKKIASGEKTVTSDTVNRALEDRFKDVSQRYPGYRTIRGGEWETTQETQQSMLRAFGIALLLIYAILIVQFKSVIQPWAILVAIPFGLIGVILALFVHGKPISFMAMMGMVGMTGVVVNDAIVLVSFINDLRREGIPVNEAVVSAARMRLRPILLTTFTTVLGLAPTIYGWGGYEPFVAPAAIVLAYGLVCATFLTLLVVPCMYTLAFSLKQGLLDGVRRLGASRREA